MKNKKVDEMMDILREQGYKVDIKHYRFVGVPCGRDLTTGVSLYAAGNFNCNRIMVFKSFTRLVRKPLPMAVCKRLIDNCKIQSIQKPLLGYDPYGGETIAVVTDKDDNMVSVGVSTCHDSDRFSRKFGSKVALSRAFSNIQQK